MLAQSHFNSSRKTFLLQLFLTVLGLVSILLYCISAFRPLVPDITLRKHLQEKINKSQLIAEDLKNVTEIDVISGAKESPPHYGWVSTLDGIENCSRLKKLRVRVFTGWSLEPLSKLMALEEIEMQYWNLFYLDELADLRSLKILRLNGSRHEFGPAATPPASTPLPQGIVDVSGLRDLRCLEVLELQEGEFTSISSLQTLRSLRSLNLSNNKRLQRVDAIEEMPGLENLDLSNCALHSIPDIWGHSKLLHIDLSGNRVVRVEAPRKIAATNLRINLRDNPLDLYTRSVEIPKLEALGVSVDI